VIPAGHPLRELVVADSRDRPAWLAAREGRFGGSDAAGFAKLTSAPLYLKAKLGEPFGGNPYTRHGNEREARMLAAYHLDQNTLMFRHPDRPEHVSTPDAVLVTAAGETIIAEAKTTNKPFTSAPPRYWRQMVWNMYVTGATRCLFIWETHEGFRALDLEPESLWVLHDLDEAARLVAIADRVQEGMASARRFREDLS